MELDYSSADQWFSGIHMANLLANSKTIFGIGIGVDMDENPVIQKQAEQKSNFFSDAKRLMSFSLRWSERSTLEKSYTAMLIAVLIGILPMPYEYYYLLRLIICTGLYFYLMAILPRKTEKRGWFNLIIGLMVLYNPIIPIHTGEQAVWMVLNAASVYALFRARLIFDYKTDDSITVNTLTD